jgi:hypothetical protein
MKKYIFIISSVISIWLTSYLSILPLNWNSQADISNLYSTSITPAWFTFSIWSIIYLSWIFLWIYIMLKNIKIKNNKILLLITAQIISALWLFPWHYNYIWISLIIMMILLSILWYLSINREKNVVFQNISDLFFWWILVASIANTHIFLVYSNLYSESVILWVISLIIWWLINYIIIKKYNSLVTSIVFIWALIWIISKQTEIFIILTSYIILIILTLIIVKNKIIKKI